MVLYDFDETLHARLYLYELELIQSGVSLHRFYVEHVPRVRSNSEACFKVLDITILESSYIVEVVFKNHPGYTQAALRVPLAVTWLTVYRQLHICTCKKARCRIDVQPYTIRLHYFL